MSNYIKGRGITEDSWTLLRYPAQDEVVKKQAGKAVLYKLTGSEAASAELIAQFALPAGRILVPLAVWRARKDELTTRLAAGEIGVWLESYELIEDLLATTADINAFPVIAYDFPKFPDGRGYSAATLLRSRHDYRNELRAVGDVLRDQLYFLQRCGFDAYVIRADRSAQDALLALNDFSEPYQGAVSVDQPLWRRHARA